MTMTSLHRWVDEVYRGDSIASFLCRATSRHLGRVVSLTYLPSYDKFVMVYESRENLQHYTVEMTNTGVESLEHFMLERLANMVREESVPLEHP